MSTFSLRFFFCVAFLYFLLDTIFFCLRQAALTFSKMPRATTQVRAIFLDGRRPNFNFFSLATLIPNANSQLSDADYQQLSFTHLDMQLASETSAAMAIL